VCVELSHGESGLAARRRRIGINQVYVIVIGVCVAFTDPLPRVRQVGMPVHNNL